MPREGLVPGCPKAPNPLCSEPLCKMPLRLHSAYTHLHSGDVKVGTAGSDHGATLWLPVRGGSQEDPGSVCNVLALFQASSGEEKIAGIQRKSSNMGTLVQHQSEPDGHLGANFYKHCPGNAKRAPHQALEGT